MSWQFPLYPLTRYVTLAVFEDHNAGDDADDEQEEFADEYPLTPAMLEGLLELERTLGLSEFTTRK